MPKTIYEYRGVQDAVYAKVLKDDSTGLIFDTVKEFAGVSEISRTTESSSEAHYYDNIPAVIIDSTGADSVTINASAIPLDILADITGQFYDSENGLFVEQDRNPGYFAFGYRTQKTDGTEVYVWRLKGTFSIPASTHQTKNDGTDANGQELTFTGISTTYKFGATGKGAKAVNIDTGVNVSMSASTFFGTVQTPDTVIIQPTVTGIGVSPSTLNLEVGDNADLTATLYPEGATGEITWEVTTGDDYASVTSAGKVTALAAGNAVITATCGTYTDTCAVTVTEPTP